MGGEDDWEIVTLDGVSTPGDYWLNPPGPRDDDGNRVDVEDVVEMFRIKRSAGPTADAGSSDAVGGLADDGSAEDMDEDEMSKILADLDSM